MLIHHRDAAGHRSPWHRSSVVHGRFAIALALVTLVATSLSLAQAPILDSRSPTAPSRALAISGNTLYVGGSFRHDRSGDRWWRARGHSRGAPAVGYPQVTGSVYAAVADGAGGWFVAGEFNRVGAEPRANLAHIRSDFSVDSWNPGTNGPIFALVLIGQTLYVGGDFTILLANHAVDSPRWTHRRATSRLGLPTRMARFAQSVIPRPSALPGWSVHIHRGAVSADILPPSTRRRAKSCGGIPIRMARFCVSRSPTTSSMQAVISSMLGA